MFFDIALNPFNSIDVKGDKAWRAGRGQPSAMWKQARLNTRRAPSAAGGGRITKASARLPVPGRTLQHKRTPLKPLDYIRVEAVCQRIDP